MIGEVDEYFYHGDHISSVVLVTDKKAKVVQQFAYMPFGELLVDNSTVDLDFRFSAKETDRESGLGYFGARYYDNTSAMWCGVDPLWEKNIGASPYNYCHGNPIMMVDPDGRDGKIIIENGAVIISANIYLWGKGATQEKCNIYQKGINDKWGGTFTMSTEDGRELPVSVQVSIKLYGGKEKNEPFIIPESWNPYNRDNFIEIEADGNLQRSYVLLGDEGKWRGQGRNGKTLEQDNPAPHELGHILGLADQYTDANGTNPGWQGNIMGDCITGRADQRNIDGILKDAKKAYDIFIKNGGNKNAKFEYEIDYDDPNN